MDLSSKKKKFDEELHNKVLRELCAGARQRKWKENPDFEFIVKGVPTTKKTAAVKSSNESVCAPSNTNVTVNSSGIDSTVENSTEQPVLNDNDVILNINFDFNSDSSKIVSKETNNNITSSIDFLLKNSTNLLTENLEFDDEDTQFME